MSPRLAHVTSGPYAPPEPVRRLTVTSADGSSIATEVHGPEDAPAVVLVHGWTCSAAFWAPVVRELAKDHRVIAYDLRGHGRSPAPGRGGYSTLALADDLTAVLDRTLAPGERAVLVGHSMGAMTLVAAADRPAVRERAAAVLLCNTGVSKLVAESLVLPLKPGRLRNRLTSVLLGARAPLGPVTPLSRRMWKYGTMGRAASPAMVEACARVIHACPTGVRAGWAQVLDTLDLEHLVEQLTVPTAVVAGSEDRLTPPVHARALAARLPHGLGLTVLPGVGHMSPVEDPDAVTGLTQALVADHLRAPATDGAGAGAGSGAGGEAGPGAGADAGRRAGGSRTGTQSGTGGGTGSDIGGITGSDTKEQTA